MAQIAVAIISCCTLGYLIGSLSPSYVIGRIRGYDVRKDGSGNAGASNAFILAGKTAFIIVAMTDILKAWLSWKLCQRMFSEYHFAGVLGGCSCLVGHIFPIWLRFKGGKGFSCLGGIVLAYDPKVFLGMLGFAIMLCFVVRYLWIVTCSMAFIFTGYYAVMTHYIVGTFLLFSAALLILWKHRVNYFRMRSGKELRLSFLLNRKKELERIGYEE